MNVVIVAIISVCAGAVVGIIAGYLIGERQGRKQATFLGGVGDTLLKELERKDQLLLTMFKSRGVLIQNPGPVEDPSKMVEEFIQQ